MRFLFDGPADATHTILLAHGAGGAMDSAGMVLLAEALAGVGLRVARFEFGYMAARRDGVRKPPPKAETLMGEYRAALAGVETSGSVFIGGKSMGGRVASMVADDLHTEGRVRGLVCIGYPFHPPQHPERLRTAHLTGLKTPALICQGTRDAFGAREEVATYGLSESIELRWYEDGDHDLKPRKRISGFTAQDHLRALARDVRAWMDAVASRRGGTAAPG